MYRKISNSFFSYLLQYELKAPNQTGNILAPIGISVDKAKDLEQC